MDSDTILFLTSLLDTAYIKIVVIAVAVIGVLSGLFSIATIRGETELLDKWKRDESKRVKEEVKGNDGRDAKTADFEGWLRNWMVGRRGKSNSHLYRRLKCILSSLEGKGGDKSLPSLRDLHDLTMQTEMSRFFPLVLRVIVSSLLIIGIIGTLVGVHNSIDQVTTKLDALQPALEPSIWAVGSTVFLLFVRGIYVGLVDKYLARLDTLTLNKLYVELQPASDLKGSISALASKINAFTQNANTLNEATDHINRSSEEMEAAAEILGHCGSQFSSLMQQTESMLTELNALNEEQKGLDSRMDTLLTAVHDDNQWLDAQKAQLGAAVQSWCRVTGEVAETVKIFNCIKELSEYLPVALNRMQDQASLLQTLQQYSERAQHRVQELEGMHRQLNERVGDAHAQVVQIRDIHAQVDEHIQRIIDDKEGISMRLHALGSQISEDTNRIRISASDCAAAVEQLRAATINDKK